MKGKLFSLYRKMDMTTKTMKINYSEKIGALLSQHANVFGKNVKTADLERSWQYGPKKCPQ